MDSKSPVWLISVVSPMEVFEWNELEVFFVYTV